MTRTKGHRKPPAKGESGYGRVEYDDYRTPSWVTELLLRLVSIRNPVLEPAAGGHDMASALVRAGLKVTASDIRDSTFPADFLGPLNGPRVWHGSIVTNPPYHAAEAFVRRALDLTRDGDGQVAMLLPFEWDCALTTRGDLFHWPFTYKIPIGRRITWIGLEAKDGDKKSGPRQNHAWFIWDWQTSKHGAPQVLYP